MMRGDTYTGVSLQTLDPKAFDHGVVLAQTPSPGLPIPPDATLQDLTGDLAKVGAEMLVQGLRDGVHVPPYTDAGWMAEHHHGTKLAHAPKVSKEDAQINWREWSPADFERHLRVFGTIWTQARFKGGLKRVLFLDAESVPADEVTGREEDIVFYVRAGKGGEDVRRRVRVDDEGDALYIQTMLGGWVRARSVKVEGKTTQRARIGMREFLRTDT